MTADFGVEQLEPFGTRCVVARDAPHSIENYEPFSWVTELDPFSESEHLV